MTAHHHLITANGGHSKVGRTGNGANSQDYKSTLNPTDP
jgi:hypothetical protein